MTVRSMMIRSSIIVLVGALISVVALLVHSFTPAAHETQTPLLPVMSTAGLALGAMVVLLKVRDHGVQWAQKMWLWTACALAIVIVIAAVIFGMTTPMPAVIMGLVALQGPVAALIISRGSN